MPGRHLTDADLVSADAELLAIVKPLASATIFAGATGVLATPRVYMLHAVVPKTGTLTDLAVYVQAGNSGLCRFAVYSVDDAHRTLLWQSPADVALGVGTNVNSFVLDQPALPVTRGQHIALGFQVNLATPTVGRMTASNAPNPFRFTPPGWVPLGGSAAGASPFIAGFMSPGAFGAFPATVDGNLADIGTNNLPLVIGRVV